jgi:hypothetical protein
MSCGLESMEQLSLGTSMPTHGELTEEGMTQVYSKYSFQRKENTENLAINKHKDKVCFT